MTETPDLPLWIAAAEREKRERDRVPKGPARILAWPRFFRARLIVEHVPIAGTPLTKWLCWEVTAEGASLVYNSANRIGLQRLMKRYRAEGYAIEHRGHERRSDSDDGRATG